MAENMVNRTASAMMAPITVSAMDARWYEATLKMSRPSAEASRKATMKVNR